MTNRGIAVLGVRLLALYLFMHCLITLPVSVAQLEQQEAWLPLVSLLAPLPLAVLLWLGAGQLASRMLPQRTAVPSLVATNPTDWYALVFAAVGLLISIQALPALLEISVESYRLTQQLQPLSFEQVATLSAALLRMMLGVAAFLGSRGLARLVAYLRTGGLSHALSS